MGEKVVCDARKVQDDVSGYVGFFFQAEDGIRDYKVTGVQTCALPISIMLTRFPSLGTLLPPGPILRNCASTSPRLTPTTTTTLRRPNSTRKHCGSTPITTRQSCL